MRGIDRKVLLPNKVANISDSKVILQIIFLFWGIGLLLRVIGSLGICCASLGHWSFGIRHCSAESVKSDASAVQTIGSLVLGIVQRNQLNQTHQRFRQFFSGIIYPDSYRDRLISGSDNFSVESFIPIAIGTNKSAVQTTNLCIFPHLNISFDIKTCSL